MIDYTNNTLTHEAMLAKMTKGWRSNETPCGAGSEKANARDAAKTLLSVCADLDVKLLADVGAGDLNWMQDVQLPADIKYHPYDLVLRHDTVAEFDCTTEVLPHAYDLVFCRHVLNHLSIERARNTLMNFKESGSEWLLMTNCQNQITYWQGGGIWPIVKPAAKTYPDCNKWWLELYHLPSIDFPA